MPDPNPIPSPLRSVNGYEILELIAAGGMSHVYRARNASGDTVAVKVVQFNEMAADYERRLRREPEIQRGIGHAHIVQLLDWFRVGGEFFLVMEYIDGRSLWRIIHDEAEALDFDRARGYLRQILPAVGHLHELGIIHRDIKPANILVARDDTAKLADFGIAKFTWQQGQTRTQLGVGTPEYMSPEQARGVAIDHRTDIYSLGITLYEMLTGRPPFAREHETPAAYSEIIQGILSQSVPDPRTIRPGIPSGAAELIARATAKDPKDRFATTAQMLRALDAVAADAREPSTIVFDAPAVASSARAAADGPEVIAAEPPDALHAGPVGRSPSLLRRPPVLIALVLLLLAGVTFAATQLMDGSSSDSDVAREAPRQETPGEATRRIASSYAHHSRAHGIEPLAALYAAEGVELFGDGPLTRDSVAAELRRDYARLARTDSFAVTVDTLTSHGDSAIDLTWSTAYRRMRTDSSRFEGATREELTLVRRGAGWFIAEHDRRMLSGVLPDGPLPTPRAAASPTPARRPVATSTRSTPKRTVSPARKKVEPPVISVRIERGPKVTVGKNPNGKGPKAKKRRK